MHEDSPNPYEAPASRGQPAAFTFKLSIVVASMVWATLALAIWFAGSALTPLFREFDMKLPLLTRMMLHPGSTLATAAVAVVLALAAMNATPRQRYAMAIVSLGLAVLFILAAAFALLSPLVILIEGLS
ncbi:hypothetical protein [Aeoliella sp. SH292]|uniref:hypothetical protein n=1 Tax=Aeoliella sp. SH292 TaxID=3454464 RepID=UPI003F9699A2